MPTREVYWNISGIVWMYMLLLPTAVVFGYGVWRQWRSLGLGRRTAPESLSRRWRRFLEYAVLQRKVREDPAIGMSHGLVFWGFLVLFTATVVVFIDTDLGLPIMRGAFYLVFQSLVVDILGFGATLGVVAMLIWRYGRQPTRLKTEPMDAVMNGCLLLILVSGFVIEGLRISLTSDPWGPWSPVGWLVGQAAVGLSPAAALSFHRILWWSHLGLAFAWLALVPYTKMFHIITAPIHIFLNGGAGRERFDVPEPAGAVTAGAAELPAMSMARFSPRYLLSVQACTECGRCDEVCPAAATGKLLSPREVVLGLKTMASREAGQDPLTPARAITGLINPEAVWSCTTCNACVSACPVLIDHVPMLVRMRQAAVERGEMSTSVAALLEGTVTRGNPWNASPQERSHWLEAIGRVALAERPEVTRTDVIYWVGCAAAFDPAAQRVAQAMIQVLQAAGVDYLVLGKQERCCGDPVRRVGDEALFAELVDANTSTLAAYDFRRLVTHCPHCLNSLRHEYAGAGAKWDVIHHSQLLQELLADGRLALDEDPAGRDRVTFHDPCYLGRLNGEYDAPREVLRRVSGPALVEMPRAREHSFCCGAGGAQMFIDVRRGTEINRSRYAEARDTGAAVVATGCPFCKTMLDAAAGEEAATGPAVRDIAEIVLERLAQGAPGTQGG